MAEESSTNNSLSSLLSALIPVLIIAIIMFLIFILLRKSKRRVYEPRETVDTVPKDLRPGENQKGIFQWLTPLLHKPRSFLIQQTGIDGYFFIRFLTQLIIIGGFGIIMLWPILFPVNATNSSKEEQLDILSFSNVSDKWRYFAHVFLSWLFFGAIIFIIYRELTYYITFRHVAQTTPLYDSILSSRTLFLNHLSKDLLEESELRSLFPVATNIWYGRNYKDLNKLVKERTKLANKYEGTVNKVVKKSVKLRNKCLKKDKPAPEPIDELNKYLKDGKKRPTHRLKWPIFGKKVDTLDYSVDRLSELNTEIAKEQSEYTSRPVVSSVFIEFPTQLELQRAYQAVPYNKTLKGVRRYSGLAPLDILWDNLELSPTKRRIKRILGNTILTLMIIFWNIPVAFVGAISNLYTLTSYAPWLSFILNMPSQIRGIINGLFPVVALAILMMLVPIFIKKVGRISGCMSVQEMGRFCQNWYYAFQVVNVFLAMSLSSAAMAAAPSIVGDPSTAMELLQQNIPKAGNFYINYFCLQGLIASSGQLAQVVGLILSMILGKLLDSTPRQKWNRWNNLGSPDWATVYPGIQLLGLAAVAYAIITPLIMGFAAITYVLIFCAWIYTLTYVLKPNPVDGRGRNYVTTLFLTFTTLYVSELWLLAMFVFSKNWPCVALEGFWIAVTAVSHVYLKWTILPLVDVVPISAIKYAAGDSTYQYPIQDQGLKEIKAEGKKYWEGGNQLGLNPTHDQVLPDVKGSEKNVFSDSDDRSAAKVASEKGASELGELRPKADLSTLSVSFFKKLLNPKLETFDSVRAEMPITFFNYVEYNDDFIRTAYEDPAVHNEEPNIWIGKDPLGLSEIEKNRALAKGVQVTNDDTAFDEKGNIIFTGAPPGYEQDIKI